MKSKTGVDCGEILIHHDFTSIPVPRVLLVKTARRIYVLEKVPVSRKTHVIFCSDRAIRRLNSTFLGKDRATDVLSFNYDDADLLGEIYVSLERASVQARHYQVSCDNEILRLFIHGMFHLLGFDHEKPGERRKMEAKESQYLCIP